MNTSYSGREVYERLIQAGECLLAEKSARQCRGEELEAAAAVEAGSFDRFFDRMEELAGVVLDRVVKNTMAHCGELLAEDGGSLQRLDAMFAYWEEQAQQIDRLREDTDGEIPAMKGHILTCLDLYSQLAESVEKWLQDAAAEGRVAVQDPAFTGRAIAFSLLSSRYAGGTERELMSAVRGAFDSLLFVQRSALAC